MATGQDMAQGEGYSGGILSQLIEGSDSKDTSAAQLATVLSEQLLAVVVAGEDALGGTAGAQVRPSDAQPAEDQLHRLKRDLADRGVPEDTLAIVQDAIDRVSQSHASTTRKCTMLEAAVQRSIEGVEASLPALKKLADAVEQDHVEARASMAELVQLKDQDRELRAARARIEQLEAQADAQVEERVSERSEEMRIVFAEEIAALREGERAAESRQKQAEEEAAQARAQLDRAAASHQQELQRLQSDLRASMTRVEAAEAGARGAQAGEQAAKEALLAMQQRERSIDGDGNDVPGAGGGEGEQALRAEAASWSQERRRLLEDLEQAEAEADRQREAARGADRRAAAATDALQEAQEARSREAEGLREQIRGLPSRSEVEGLRGELEALQNAVAGSGEQVDEGEDEDGDGDSDGGKSGTPKGKAGGSPLARFAARIRQLESKLVSCRRDLAQEKEGRSRAEEQSLALQDEAGDLRGLVARLERDVSLLSSARDLRPSGRDGKEKSEEKSERRSGGSGAAAEGKDEQPRGAATMKETGSAGADVLARVVGGQTAKEATVVPQPVPQATSGGSRSQEGAREQGPTDDPAGASLGQVGLAIRAQRDRFREQVLELEERLASAEDDARAARRRQESLREESVRLYQKVKFLESVRGFSGGRGALAAPSPILDSEEGEVEGVGGTESGLGGRRSGSSGAGLSDGPIGAAAARTSGRGGGGAEDEAEAGEVSRGARTSASGNERAAQDQQLLRKYEAIYDRRSNPFQTFKRRERQRREANLNALDRGALLCAKALAHSRLARIIVAIYLVVLHVLALAVVLTLAHHDTRSNVPKGPIGLSRVQGPGQSGLPAGTQSILDGADAT